MITWADSIQSEVDAIPTYMRIPRAEDQQDANTKEAPFEKHND